MEKVRNNYPDIYTAGGQLSRGIRAGNMLFISGCTARATPAEGGPIVDQFQATLGRIKAIMEAEGGTMTDIVMVTTYVTSMDEWQACRGEREKIYEECFKGQYPTNTLVAITALAAPNLNVEVNAIAVL